MFIRLMTVSIPIVMLPIVLLTSAPAQSNNSSYPDDYVNQYIEDCSDGLGDEGEAVCSCIIQEAQREYTFDEFVDVSAGIEETGDIPDVLQIIIDVCYEYNS